MQRADSLSFRETAREGCFPAARVCAREHEWSQSEGVCVGPPALFVFLWLLGFVYACGRFALKTMMRNVCAGYETYLDECQLYRIKQRLENGISGFQLQNVFNSMPLISRLKKWHKKNVHL